MRTTTMTRRRRTLLACSAAVTVATLAAGCQGVTPSASAEGTAGPSAGSVTTPALAPAAVTVTPADGATSMRPDAPITVTASDGVLTDVTVTDADGHDLLGRLSGDKASWTSSGRLALRSTYTVRVAAANAEGRPTTQTATLRTLTPKDTADFYLLPAGQGQVGVGMPVVVRFAGLVDKDKQAAIEKRVSVTTVPKVDGAWGWLDARQLIWRPAKYWAPGTKVTVQADIAGLETRPGVWTSRDASNTFSIGSAMVSTVDTRTHRMTVTRDGKVLKVLKVSTGRPGSETETRNGIKVILSREKEHVMDSATIGIKKGEKGYYKIDTKFAMRLTWSGEFLHSAPWSVGSQGNANVSHGCTNLAPADAEWLFNHSKMGDVVKFTGSSRTLEEYNGYTMWNESLAQWAKHSAIA